ncbi:MAG: phytanoyl-CoA dioxygenase, partial [Paracoccaceae bacterium]
MVERTLGYIPYFNSESCDLDEFKVPTSSVLSSEDVPRAAEIVHNVPVYDMSALRADLSDPAARRALMAEWAYVLRHSAGVIALKSVYTDVSVIDRATDVFNSIIDQERIAGAGQGDHFAAAGANDRVWNSLQKHCMMDPENYVAYFGNAAIAAACEAWL